MGAPGSPARLGEPPKVTRVAEPGDTEVSEELRPAPPGLAGPDLELGHTAVRGTGVWLPAGPAGELGAVSSGGCGSGGAQTAVCLASHRGRSPPSWEAESRALPFSRFQIPLAFPVRSASLLSLAPSKAVGRGVHLLFTVLSTWLKKIPSHRKLMCLFLF